MCIEIIINKQKTAVCVVYRPPTADNNIFMNFLDDIFSTVCPVFTNVVLLGDINLNLLENSGQKREFTKYARGIRYEAVNSNCH